MSLRDQREIPGQPQSAKLVRSAGRTCRNGRLSQTAAREKAARTGEPAFCYNALPNAQGGCRMLAAAEKPSLALDDPSLYINRELSWLEFNRRVLEEAQDPNV